MQLVHENDIEILRQKAMLLQRENELLHKRLAELTAALDKAQGKDAASLQQELALLQEQLQRQVQALFGKSSEKRPAPEPSKPKPDRKPQPGHGPREQPRLPVVEQVHELDDADKVCNACGGGLRPMAGQFEEADEVDIVERSFRIVRHKRQKYRCGCGGCIDTALGPPKLVTGGRYSVAFAAHVAVAKYLDHSPLSRLASQMCRQGLVIDSQTLWDQIEALARHLQDTYTALWSHVLDRAVVGADETRWPLLDGNGKTWWAWSITSRNGAWYRIARSRSHEEAGKLLGDFSGTVVSDAYSAYEALRKVRARAGPTFRAAHCWAHSRRRYVQAEPHYPEAKEALDLIAKLYAIDAKAAAAHEPGSDAWRELLARLRSTESKAVLKEIQAWRKRVRVLPSGALGRAVYYMDNNWTELTVFVDDPDVPLDNNDTERGIRGLAVGRKVHYGSKSLRGTEVAALFYSLLETAKRVGVHPEQYLIAAALKAIEQPGAVLLPHQFAESQQG